MVVPDRQSAEADKSDDLSGGAIAGIVIGVLALLALLALAAFFLWRHHRNKQDPNNPHGYPEMATAANPRPRRNVSVLSKVGLLARSGHYSSANDDDNDPHSAGPSHSARHSALYAAGANDGVAPSSPLGPQSNAVPASTKRTRDAIASRSCTTNA
jgi:hypothetical protein